MAELGQYLVNWPPYNWVFWSLLIGLSGLWSAQHDSNVRPGP